MFLVEFVLEAGDVVAHGRHFSGLSRLHVVQALDDLSLDLLDLEVLVE